MDQPQNPNHPDPLTPPGSAGIPPAAGEERPSRPRSQEEAEAAGPPPPMTPVAWLLNNGVYLVLLAALVGWGLHKVGPEVVWHITLGILGLGFLIFVHELGHFATAKWCDVHVQTFSIGFGPALPGCSFQRGETTYKIGVIPLGGYVNMVGEGPEADEDEHYPRSFKNKSVGQRMLIISAGVIMNILVGGILFVLVFMYHGDYRPAGIVGAVEPGSPAWDAGVRSGMVITNLDGTPNPSFNDLKIAVVLTTEGERVPFVFQMPGGKPLEVPLLPRKDKSDPNPVIGVLGSDQLKLPAQKTINHPVMANSAAAAARPLGLQPGDEVVAATDPAHPEQLTDLPKDSDKRYKELAQRMKQLVGQKLVLRVKPGGTGKPVEHEVPLEGFTWDDTIIGTSKPPARPGDPYDPLVVQELPRDPRHRHQERYDPFEYRRRMQQLVGLPMVIRVRREGASADSQPVDLFVPPAYHYTLGMRMKMGEISALRDGSPAVTAGVQKGDVLVKAVMLDDKDKAVEKWGEKGDLDPERLPDQMRNAARSVAGPKKVVLTVRRSDKDTTLKPVDWEDSWDYDVEIPLSRAAPLAIPQVGLAYRIESRIAHVDPKGPAANAHVEDKDNTPYPLEEGDRIDALRFRTWSVNYQDTTWDNRVDLAIPRDDKTVYDGWARILPSLQAYENKSVLLTITRPNVEAKNPIVVEAREDDTWPLVNRGIRLQADYQLQKADSFGQALGMGARKTVGMIKLLYMQIRSLATGRVSVNQVGGPIEMGAQAFAVASMGYWELLGFLGVISINLAVVNFLPIPVLDGGHMVFLIYEKLRGRPPSEGVRVVATYIGLAAIGCLMIFVFYQDIRKHIFGL